MGMYDLPMAVRNIAQHTLDAQALLALESYWLSLMLGCQIAGFILCAGALQGLYKMHRYRQPHYGEWKIPLFIVGVLLANMNRFIEIMANTFGIGS